MVLLPKLESICQTHVHRHDRLCSKLILDVPNYHLLSHERPIGEASLRYFEVLTRAHLPDSLLIEDSQARYDPNVYEFHFCDITDLE